jgi:hypothetical protein
MKHENPKHKTGDGAGFGRLRAEQAKRDTFKALIERSHPMRNVYIDQIRDYCGAQVVFYRRGDTKAEVACIAVFQTTNGVWVKEQDIIAAIEGVDQ